MNFVRFNRSHTCPVCTSGTKGCSKSSDTLSFSNGLFFCRGESLDGSFHFLKTSKDGVWNIYADVRDVVELKETSKTDWVERQQLLREQQKVAQSKEQARLSRLTSVSTRNTLLQSLFSAKSISQAHKSNLLLRGLSEQSIRSLQFVSLKNGEIVGKEYDVLAGFKHGKYIGASGLICPTFSVKGDFTGFQVMCDDTSKGKYKWTVSGEVSAHLQSGELPLTVCGQGSNVALCEGILKPLVASEKHSLRFIGASGGNFAPIQLQDALKSLNPTNNTVTLFPDSNYLGNKEVYRQVAKTVNLVISFGYSVLIADWQHGFSKVLGEIDEISSLADVRYLPFNTIEAFFNNPLSYLSEEDFSSLLTPLQRTLQPQKFVKALRPLEAVKSTSTSADYYAGELNWNSLNFNNTFEGSARPIYEEAIRKGFKHVLDNSATGSGKTQAASEINLANCKASRLFYLSTQSRNPSVEKLESDFSELPARNKGYDLNNSKLTPLGNAYRVATTQKEPDIKSNCHLTDAFIVARQKDFEVEICKKCKFSYDCNSRKGEGYGFKHQLRAVLPAQKIRANPQSLSASMMTENNVLVVDEYSQSAKWLDTVEVTVSDVQATLAHLSLALNVDGAPELIGFVGRIYTLLQKPDAQKFGLHTKEILKDLGGIDVDSVDRALTSLEDSQRAFNDENFNFTLRHSTTVIDAILDKNWLRLLLSVVSGATVNSSLFKKSSALTITVRNERWVDVVAKASTVIWQDATGNRDELALKLGCRPSEILVVNQKQPSLKNLQILQIQGLGKANNVRSPGLMQRLGLVRQTLESIHSDIGFIEFKRYSTQGDLIHFGDAIGSNSFQKRSTTASMGVPYPNVSAIRSQFEALAGCSLANDYDDQFKLYYDSLVMSNVIQEIGRIRANRRGDECLIHYILADLDIRFLNDLGYNVAQDHVVNINEQAVDKQTRARLVLKDAFKYLTDKGCELASITQQSIADIVKTTQQNISKLSKGLGGFENLKKTMAILIFGEIDHLDCTDALDADYAFLAETYLPLLSDCSPGEVFEELRLLVESYNFGGFCKILSSVDCGIASKLLATILNSSTESVKDSFLSLGNLLVET